METLVEAAWLSIMILRSVTLVEAEGVLVPLVATPIPVLMHLTHPLVAWVALESQTILQGNTCHTLLEAVVGSPLMAYQLALGVAS
jgi:hypothetical protein